MYEPNYTLQCRHNGSLLELEWRFSYPADICGNGSPALHIKTQEDDLWPPPSDQVHVVSGTHYHVNKSEFGPSEGTNMSVVGATLLLNLSDFDFVVTHVPFVICIMTAVKAGQETCKRISDVFHLAIAQDYELTADCMVTPQSTTVTEDVSTTLNTIPTTETTNTGETLIGITNSACTNRSCLFWLSCLLFVIKLLSPH